MSILKDETVILKFIPDFRNGISDKKHPLYGGLSSNATISIPAPLLTRQLENIFSKEELTELSKELNGEDLSPNSAFWREYRKDDYGMPKGDFPIFLRKEGAIYNKKNALDFIKVRILENCNIVAKSPDEIKNRSTNRFVLIKHNEQHKGELDKINWIKEATKLHTKFENDSRVLKHVLKIFNKNVAYDSKIDFLQKETWKLLEVAPQMFVSALADTLLEAKIVLDEAVRYKLINKSNKLYYSLSGETLRLDGDLNDYVGAARYLDSGAGQEYRLELEAKINTLRK